MIADKHCMIDLETLGINPNAPIIQVGIVYFTIDGVYLSSQINIDFEDALKHGKADGATIKWWLQQSKEAQDSLAKNEKSAVEACEIIVVFYLGRTRIITGLMLLSTFLFYLVCLEVLVVNNQFFISKCVILGLCKQLCLKYNGLSVKLRTTMLWLMLLIRLRTLLKCLKS